jgi:hypothetical protein
MPPRWQAEANPGGSRGASVWINHGALADKTIGDLKPAPEVQHALGAVQVESRYREDQSRRSQPAGHRLAGCEAVEAGESSL